MRCILKAIGLAFMVIIAINAMAVQGVSAAEESLEFHTAVEKAVFTGIDTNTHELTIGTAGVVQCSKVETEATQTGTEVSTDTYESDQVTVTPRYSECTFGGNPATVNFEHCAYVFDSDTTGGNTTNGEEHANVEIECAEGSSIKIATSKCTITIGAQTLKHAVRYQDDPENEDAVNMTWTAHGIVIGNLNDKAGCVLIPKGAVGKYVGATTATCYHDRGSALNGTGKTTPQGVTNEGVECGEEEPEHEFHADGEKVNGTGINLGVHEFRVGSFGVMECGKVESESTDTGDLASTGTYETDQVTVTPRYSECTFGGNPATLTWEHCAAVFDSDTTAGNSTGGEHANVEIECAEGSSIKMATSTCTLTVEAQTVADAVHYENDPENKNAIKLIGTAHGIVLGNLNDKAGCSLFPKGPVLKYVGNATATCFRDQSAGALNGTTRTTPTGLTEEGPKTECEIGNP